MLPDMGGVLNILPKYWVERQHGFACAAPQYLGLNEWRVDPMVEDFLVLDTVKCREPDGQTRIYSLEKRRLYCLKKHQQSVRPWTVYVGLHA